MCAGNQRCWRMLAAPKTYPGALAAGTRLLVVHCTHCMPLTSRVEGRVCAFRQETARAWQPLQSAAPSTLPHARPAATPGAHPRSRFPKRFGNEIYFHLFLLCPACASYEPVCHTARPSRLAGGCAARRPWSACRWRGEQRHGHAARQATTPPQRCIHIGGTGC